MFNFKKSTNRLLTLLNCLISTFTEIKNGKNIKIRKVFFYLYFRSCAVIINIMENYDVIIIGAGAAGLMAAAQLQKREKSVLIIDMGDAPARKIAISGGGKCNFTNLSADYTRYFGKNPQFTRSALSQWTPNDTLNWVKSHRIQYFEKEPGRFFCKNSAQDIVNALITDIKDTKIQTNTSVLDVEKQGDIFETKTDKGSFYSQSLIIATGGLSYPHLGVSNIGHIIARKFGHKTEPIRPALCALKTKCFSTELAGISLPVEITVSKKTFVDDLLFTHFGIGGPAAYRASLICAPSLTINFAPGIDIADLLKKSKRINGRKTPASILAEILPNKLAHFLCDIRKNIADLKDTEIEQITTKINKFKILDATTMGLQNAEVTAGGISTDKISSKTMESLICPGLFFAGETIDITGDLGGFNIQWAFSSGFVAGINA